MSSSSDQRATKIVATIGTASGSPDRLLELLEAGVNVFRLNFSHGTQQEQAERIRPFAISRLSPPSDPSLRTFRAEAPDRDNGG